MQLDLPTYLPENLTSYGNAPYYSMYLARKEQCQHQIFFYDDELPKSISSPEGSKVYKPKPSQGQKISKAIFLSSILQKERLIAQPSPLRWVKKMHNIILTRSCLL